MSGGVTFDSDFAAATTDRYLGKTARDQFFNHFGLLGIIEDKIGFDRISGGDNILQPIETAANAQVDSYAGYDQFDNTPQEILTNAVFGWKGYYVSVVAQAFEIFRNQSAEGQLNIWSAKVENALKSLRNQLNADAYLDGTGNGGKDILGLAILVDSAGTMGGIARASNAFWQSVEVAAGGALTIEGDVGMMRAMHQASPGSGMDMIDCWLTTFAVVEAYHQLLSPGIRYNSLGRGDAMFGDLAFKGAPLKWDHAATANTLFGLATGTFKGWIHPLRNFKSTKIAKADDATLNQDAWSMRILVWPEIACIEPRRNVKITGIT